MNIRTIPGKKAPGDLLVLMNGSAPTFIELAYAIKVHFDNEERIYPRPRYLGGKKLLQFLEEACKLPSGVKLEEVARFYDNKYRGNPKL